MEGRRRKKKPLSRLAKTFLSYALIAALALPPQAAWATIPEGTMDEDGALAIGVDSSAGHMCTSVGSNALAGLQSSTFGYQANAEGTYSSAFGYQANAYATNSVALGANSVASEAYTVSVGGNGTTRRIVNVAEGTADTDAATVGQLASLGSEVADIIGANIGYDGGSFSGAINIGGMAYNTIEAALNALYIGTAGSTGGAVCGDKIVIDPSKDAVTIARGGNIQITQDAEDDNKFTIGVIESPTFSAVNADNANIGGITVGSGGINMGDKKITGLAEGEITAGSTDAVTGGQLHATNEEIEGIRDAIATGDYDIFTGKSLAVKYDDTDKASVTLGDPAAATARAANEGVELKNIADGTDDLDAVNKRQLDAVQGQVDVHKTTLNEHTVMIENHEEQFTTLQTVLGDTYETPTFNRITIGNIISDGANIDMGGGTITGLADGNIAQGSTDAVTGNQLWEAYRRMGDMQEAINVVGAHAAALSGLHPIQYNPYEPTTLSAAVGTYRDEYAVAVGVFHYVRSNVLFNLGASICSDGDVMGRAGVSLAVGKGGRKKPELARDMVGMQQQMIAMQAMLEELKEENAKNKETIKKNEETIKELKEALGKKK